MACAWLLVDGILTRKADFLSVVEAAEEPAKEAAKDLAPEAGAEGKPPPAVSAAAAAADNELKEV